MSPAAAPAGAPRCRPRPGRSPSGRIDPPERCQDRPARSVANLDQQVSHPRWSSRGTLARQHRVGGKDWRCSAGRCSVAVPRAILPLALVLAFAAKPLLLVLPLLLLVAHVPVPPGPLGLP